jgi:hypothetical protein
LLVPHQCCLLFLPLHFLPFWLPWWPVNLVYYWHPFFCNSLWHCWQPWRFKICTVWFYFVYHIKPKKNGNYVEKYKQLTVWSGIRLQHCKQILHSGGKNNVKTCLEILKQLKSKLQIFRVGCSRLLLAFSVYSSSALNMEAVCSTEMLVSSHQNTWIALFSIPLL